MVTLFASIAGFIGSIIPELLKFLKDRNDKKHELNIMDKQIAYQKQEKKRRLEETEIANDVTEQANLYATYNSGISFIDAVNASVRPMLAYSFFGMYAWIKFMQYKIAASVNMGLQEQIYNLWSADDQAIFAGIISFYFGQRTFSKLWQYKFK